MRIALFTDSYPPRVDGIARVCQLERREWERMGHEVMVVCPKRPGAQYADDPHIIGLPSSKAYFYEGLYLGRMTKQAKQQLGAWKPDVVRIHTQVTVGMAGLRFARRRHIPVATTWHADFDLAAEYPGFMLLGIWVPLILRLYAGYRTRLGELPRFLRDRQVRRRYVFSRWIFSQFSNASDYTFIPSAKLTAQVAPYIRTPLHTIGFGAELPPKNPTTAKQVFRKRFGISPEAFVAVSTTRLVKEKRTDLTIRGFAQARALAPNLDIVLAILGSGPERPALQKLAHTLGVHDRVLFLGSVNNQELRQFLQECNVYVNACMRENFPLSACEGSLAQLPLLMSDPGLSETFVPDVTGLQFDTPQQFGVALTRLAAQPALCQRLGKAAYAHAEQYTPPNAVKRMYDILRPST